MPSLSQTIALVAGASRGAGKGIALALADACATVYVAARTSRNGPKPADGIPGTVEDTAKEVSARGGQGIPVSADLSDFSQAEALFRRIEQEHGRLDLVADSAWTPVFSEWSTPFWELRPDVWRDLMSAMEAALLVSVHAARIMVRQRRGLIIHVTDNLNPDTSAYRGEIVWDIGHEFLNRLITDLSHELRRSRVAVVGLNPGFMRTERVLREMTNDAIKKQFRFDLSETTAYIGRAAVALASDPNVFAKTGELLWVADLAAEFGFTDIDGRRIPRFDPKAPVQPYPC